MIILTTTTDTLQAVLAGNVTTAQLQSIASYRDITTTSYTPGRHLTTTNNTSDSNIVTSPAASTQRVVDYVSIYNSDTANATVTIKYDANGSEYILFKTTLGVTERLEYTNEKGWQVYTSTGAIKTSLNQGNNVITSGLSAAVLASNVTNNNAVANTIATVTGLGFPVVSGNTYYFKFIIWYTAAATTTGSRWSINGPTNSLLGYRQSWTLGAAGTSGTDVFTDNSGTTYDSPSAANASSATQTSGQANIAIIEGLITVTANGTVDARFASEVANSAIVAKAGSVVYYQQVL